MIVGIDEVGRGAWAGPMVVGAVLLGGATIEGLTDSKKLTKKQREALDSEIRKKAVAIGIGWVSAKQIDTIGLSAALKLASRRAMAHIRCEYSEIVIDGTIALIDDSRVTLMKKADSLVPSVSAASVVAKVARDAYMRQLDEVFPGYAFAGHVGYGTAAHRTAIERLGVTPLHRLSFAPLQQYDNTHVHSPIKPTIATRGRVVTKQIGDAAETEVANYLVRVGHKVIARNWRTKFCEIDIISLSGGTIYFTEVKYRRSDAQGDGLAAITPKKQRQMKFAAEIYVQQNKLQAYDLRLAAASVGGAPPDVLAFLELD